MKKTLILGASTNPARYSYTAIKRLRDAGHEVVAIGRTKGKVGDVLISDSFPKDDSDIHTISLYLRSELQSQYYEELLNLNAKRIIFNPGTENKELYHFGCKMQL